TLMQTLRNPSAQRDDALLLQLIDRAEVHLSGVDQVAHVSPIVFTPASRLRSCSADRDFRRLRRPMMPDGKIRRWPRRDRLGSGGEDGVFRALRTPRRAWRL